MLTNSFKLELFKDLNECFEAVFNSNKAKYPKLDIGDMKVGYCEDLPIEDSSIDAVVITLVLCSVQDQDKCFREIKRVLKPGGKFFYMEHIVDDTDSTLRLVQQILTTIGFWQWAFAGCCIDRPTAEAIEAAGFTKVDQKKYDLPFRDDISMIFTIVRIFVKRHVLGVCHQVVEPE